MSLASFAPSNPPLIPPEDPKLPQLGKILDASSLAEFLDGQLPSGGFSVAYVRYKPRTNCIVLYSTEASDGPRPLFYLKVFAQDWMPGEFDRSRMLVWSPRQRTAVLQYPRDLEMPALECVSSSEEALRIFERALRWKYRGRIVPSPESWRLVRYKPERRCVLRGKCVDRSKSRATGFYARFYAGAEGEDTYQWHKHLENPTEAVKVPRPLGYSRTHRCLLLAEVSGRPLSQHFTLPLRHLADAVDATAKGLARWHRIPPPAGVEALPPAADILNSDAQMLEGLLQGGSPADAIARQLIRTEPVTSTPSLLHGDFYYDQVLLTRRLKPRFLDLDELALGNPLYDVGTFCAHIRLLEAQDDLSLPLADWICRRFVDSYDEASDSRLPHKDCAWYLSMALLRVAILPFRCLDPCWPRLTRSILRAAAKAAEEAV